MVHAALALLLPAVLALPAAASQAPSFETSAASLHAELNALRAARVRAAASDVGPQLDALAWDLDRAHQDVSSLRRALPWLAARARAYRPPTRTRPESDPTLRWDLQTAARALQTLASNAQWSLDRLRMLSSRATKDDSLVLPARRVSGSAQTLRAETTWLGMDARLATNDIRFAGFAFEAMDIDGAVRDLESRSFELTSAASALLAKAGG